MKPVLLASVASLRSGKLLLTAGEGDENTCVSGIDASELTCAINRR